jgi:hypothetical protein
MFSEMHRHTQCTLCCWFALSAVDFVNKNLKKTETKYIARTVYAGSWLKGPAFRSVCPC